MPAISTIQKREYVEKRESEGFTREYERIILSNNSIKEETKNEKVGNEKGKLFPTDLGILVNRFLLQYFENIIDYGFTASVEKDFDEIAQGTVTLCSMIDRSLSTPPSQATQFPL